MLRGFKRQLMLLLALAGLGVGSAVAESLTKYTVTYGDAPAVSAASATPVLKALKLAAAPRAVHTITFNVTGDVPYVVKVTDMDSAEVTVALPVYYEYLGATVDGLDVVKDAEALWWDWIEVDVETLTFTFDQVVADHQVNIRCNPPKYVAMTGNDRNDGSLNRPFRTIQRGVNACNGASGYVIVLPGVYEPFSCPNAPLHVIAQGPVGQCVIDGGGTNRCATMGSAYGENAAELVGFTLRNGRVSGEGGGVLYGCVVRCSIIDCRAEGKGGGVSGAAVENTLIATCMAGGSGNLANASDLRNCTLRDSAETGVSVVDSTVRNCVATSEGGAQLLKGVTVFSHSVTNVTYAYPLRPATGRLLAGSPGLGAGDVSLVAAGETDLDGNPRLTTRGFATTVNCGCYESAVGTCTVRGTIRGVNPWGTNELHVAVGGDIPMPFGFTVHWLSVNGKELPYLPIPGGPFISGVTEGMTFETYITAKRYADEKNGNDANDGFTPETAKKTLQAAIDIAPGATDDAADSAVYVAPGTYGPIATDNRRIEVLGTKGVRETVIYGGNTNRCADLGGGDDNGLTNTVLRGFTVRNGRCDECGGGVRGGTVIACEITNNEADDYGGGVAFSTVRDSLIARNVNGCYESACGGACYGGSYFNCTIVDNSAPNGSGYGFSAGVYGAQELVNCVVQANRDEDGVERNTYGIARQVATVTSGADFADSARGDWRLTRYSPGVGTGDLSYVMDATDLDGFNRTTTNAEGKVTVNSGCYERTFPCLIRVTYTLFNPYDGTNEFREVDGNGPLVPRGYAVTELTVNGVPAAKLPQAGEPLVTGVRARTEVVVRFASRRYADAEHGDDANDGLSPDKPKKTLQAAIDIAPWGGSSPENVVFAAPGVYTPIATENRWMTVVGTEGAAKTIIDGGNTNRCADLSGSVYKETSPEKVSRTLLRGFTLRNGYVSQDREEGAGVRGGTVVACVISGNKTYERPGSGCAYSIVRESLIVGNQINCVTCLAGTGAYDCWLYNCTVVFNRAQNTRPSEGGYGVTGGRAVNCVVQSNDELLRHERNVDDDVEQTATTTSGAVFANAENGDFHLKPGSAGIAAGDLKHVMDATDLDGVARVTVDAKGQRSINCGCYETVAWAKIRMTYTGVDPYGTNEFAAVDGFGPIVPRGFAVTELAVNGKPAAKLPAVGEPLVSGIVDDTEVVVRFVAARYADAANGNDANDGLSPDKAKKTLQAAIDIAQEGRTASVSAVFAAPGVYAPIATANRKISVIGTGGAGETAIDGGGASRCADLSGERSSASTPALTNTVLKGFTVRKGRVADDYGAGVRGGTVVACVVSGNTAYQNHGGGCDSSVVRESLIVGNRIEGLFNPYGAGALNCWLYNCTVVSNSADRFDPKLWLTSYGVHGGRAVNCIVQGNRSDSGEEVNVWGTELLFTVTNGAVFANAANGDYHLKPESAGVAAGDVESVIDMTDLEGAPRLTTNDTGGVTVNCGCYETLRRFRIHVTYTGVDPYGKDEFLDVEGNGPLVPRGYAVTELAVNGKPAARLPAVGEPLVSGVNEDKEVVVRFATARYADAVHGNDANDGLSPDKAKQTLQAAIGVAPAAESDAADSVVFAAPGVYGPIMTSNRKLTVLGAEGAAETVIDGGRESRCADLGGGNDNGRTNTVLRGFTVKNGRVVDYGGGVRGGTVISCVIADNVADDFGGGVAYSTVRESLITRNANNRDGNAIGGAGCYGNYLNCTIVGNSAPNGSGDLFSAGVYGAWELVNCVVQGNYGKDGVERNTCGVMQEVATVTSGAVFAGAANGDYHLKAESAGVAEGDVTEVFDATDLEGAARLTTNDMGVVWITVPCIEAYRTLRDGGTYKFLENTDYTAAGGQSAMKVERGASVVLEIPRGVTVTLRGGDAAGRIGAGAGIEVPMDAKLSVIGAGRLVAVGGNAANGCDGGKAPLGWVRPNEDGSGEDRHGQYRGVEPLYLNNGGGGRGGDGGGGAGAGIGCRGGEGGMGGAGAVAQTGYWSIDTFSTPGNPGFAGGRGVCSMVAGRIAIAPTVSVDARPGAAGTSGGKGGEGEGVRFVWHENHFGAWGGGGGGGGGAGGAAIAGIGAGGVGGGGGGGGGAGSLEWFASPSRFLSHDLYGAGGLGGQGATGSATGNGGNGTNKLHESITINGVTGKTGEGTNPGLEWAPPGGPGAGGEAGIVSLPQGYTPVAYIESTPGGGQYIDTGYSPTANTRIVADFCPMTLSQNWGVFFGVTGGDRSSDGVLLRYYENSNVFNGWFCNETYQEARIDNLASARILAELGEGGMTLNGQFAGITTTSEPYYAPIYIFCGNNGGKDWRHQAMRLYAFRCISDGKTLERDFVPCVSATGEAGLYDLVHDKFYGNAGRGQFKVSDGKPGIRGVSVNCGCYETIAWAKIRLTYTGVDPYGTNEFVAVGGYGPEVPRGSEVTELTVNGAPVEPLPQVGEPLVNGVMADTEVVVHFTAQRYADAANGNDANDGLSPDKAKKTLQAAIDAAPEAVSDAADSVVFAAPGTYAPIVCPNRRLSVIGTGGPGQVAIDAKNTSSRCATLRGSDSIGTNTVLSGVTLRNGNWNESLDVVNGGGAYGGTLVGCVITNCCASQFGGGAACSALRNCLVARNRALAIFAQNPPGAGGYAVWCSNCTVVDNAAPRTRTPYGLGLSVESGSMVVNSIVQGNTGLDGASGAQVWSPLDTKSTIEDGAKFVNAANGDYHLKTESAGIAYGNVDSVMDATDLEGAPRLTTNALGLVTVNCGCYETIAWAKIRLTYTGVDPYGTNEFLAVGGFGPKVPRGFAVTELTVKGAPVAKLPQVGEPLVSGVMADTEVVVHFTAQRYADAKKGSDANDGLSPDKAKKTLQAAIDIAPTAASNASDSVVFAAPGTYAPIATENRKISVVGTEGAARTIIDGGGKSRCADLSGYDVIGRPDYIRPLESTNTVLAGFTVCNGYTYEKLAGAGDGAGVRGGTVVACVISGNTVYQGNGGGCYDSVLRESLIVGNRIEGPTIIPDGAAALSCLLYNCTVVSNTASMDKPEYRDMMSYGICGGWAFNCIVQDNRSASGVELNVRGSWMLSTVTNGAVFVDAANGDFHLKNGSAGVAAGNVAYVMDKTDLEGAARLTTNAEGCVTVSCGCYETLEWAKIRLTYTGVDPYGTNVFVAVNGFGPDVPRGYAVTELTVNGASVEPLPQVGEPLVSGVMADTEVVVHFTAQRYADAKKGSDANDGLSPDKAKKTLQAAIDIAPTAASNAADSVVFAAPGTYAPIATANRKVSVIGTGGAGETFIDGGDRRRCADLSGYDGYEAKPTCTNTVLTGFTLCNGHLYDPPFTTNSGEGAGVRGGTVIACVVSGNMAVKTQGGGCAYSVVRESLIVGNRIENLTNPQGAGACNCWLYNCTVVANSAEKFDLEFRDGTSYGVFGGRAVNCIVQGNRSDSGVELNVGSSTEAPFTVTNGAVFADAANGDYHLMSDGAGVAAGNVAYVMDKTDLEGAARLTTNAEGCVTVSCGCYETVKEDIRFVKIEDGGEIYLIPYVWLEAYGLAPRGSDYATHYTSATNVSANPVGPGATAVLPAWKSYVAGLDPTNAVEMFYSVITAPSNGWFRVGPNEVRTGRAYTVRETGVLRGAAVTNLWPIAEGRDSVDVEDNGTNSFFKVGVRVK